MSSGSSGKSVIEPPLLLEQCQLVLVLFGETLLYQPHGGQGGFAARNRTPICAQISILHRRLENSLLRELLIWDSGFMTQSSC
jgi:hypothetical protein